ncbi:MAG: AraC family transcriptional regulator [Tissierellia bacterium]|nr:AraC family transcriptional regulator [Tissierellia bacterium]
MEERSPKYCINGCQGNLIVRDGETANFGLSGVNGKSSFTGYQVFEGIHLLFNNVENRECSFDCKCSSEILEINFCKEGRFECETVDSFFYLKPGDLSISLRRGMEKLSYFPLSEYNGVSIVIDLGKVPCCLSCFMEDVNVRPTNLAMKFCGDRSCFVTNVGSNIKRVFQDLFDAPKEILKGYYKIKVLELFLYLNSLNIEEDQLVKGDIPKSQILLARRLCHYLNNNLSRRVTIKELATEFDTSETYIKSCFKKVYGDTIYSHTRSQKMHMAASLLRQSSLSVLEIAGSLGYDNGSKFAKAFSDVLGSTPMKYRKNHRADSVLLEQKMME